VSGPIDGHLVLITRRGVAKRLTVDELEGTKSGSTVIRLKDDDELAAAFPCPDGADVIIVADTAVALRTPVDAISVQGRGAAGVAGMKLKDDAKVIAAGPVDPDVWDGVVVSVVPGAEAKATPFDELAAKGRGTGGVRLHKLRDAKPLTAAHVGSLESLWVLMSTDDDPTKLDPTPVPFTLEPTKRDLTPSSTDRQILGFGSVRW
jgi:DNA gyrase subunit A